MLKNRIHKLIPPRIFWLLNALRKGDVQPAAQIAHGQEAEDLILARMLSDKRSGFFVDVGAHHPTRFSNTWKFYSKGWSGLNIDANPDSITLFEKYRPRDINICCGVGEKEDELEFFLFEEGAVNTFDEELARYREKQGFRRKGSQRIQIRPLSSILADHLPNGTTIDFMSIDVEGLDEMVVRSNNWEKFRPRYLLIEILDSDLISLGEVPVVKSLRSFGYMPVAKTFNTLFLKDEAHC